MVSPGIGMDKGRGTGDAQIPGYIGEGSCGLHGPIQGPGGDLTLFLAGCERFSFGGGSYRSPLRSPKLRNVLQSGKQR